MPRILIIDDDITALDLIDLLFRKSGFESMRLLSGLSANKTIVEYKPDVLLIDLMMPDISGADTIKAIRADGHDLPIIAFTAQSDSDYQDLALQAGANQVLTKPYSTSKLVTLISEYVNKKNEVH